jgi:hypothetical protein
MSRRHVGFMIMPFRPELNYFYLYLQRHLAERHRIDLARGDTEVLTRPLIDKIRGQILAADVILADITGNNPNVFFELGLADAAGKPIIFLTQEAPEDAPVDVKPFEMIRYDLGRHMEFLDRLDNALRNVFGDRHRALYERGLEVLHDFNEGHELREEPATYDEFHARVELSELTIALRDPNDAAALAEFVLPKIVRNIANLATSQRVSDWLAKRFATAPRRRPPPRKGHR